MLVTIDRYRAITGDQATAALTVTARIDEAVELLEDDLQRWLPAEERTEVMQPTRDGSLWPKAIPVSAVATAGWSVDGNRLYGAFPLAPFSLVDPTIRGVSITYTGGWVERTADPAAANALPACIERDLAWAAYTLGQTSHLRAATTVPAGATAVALGDASVSFGPGGATSRAPGAGNYSWSRRTLGYRYIRIGGRLPCFP